METTIQVRERDDQTGQFLPGNFTTLQAQKGPKTAEARNVQALMTAQGRRAFARLLQLMDSTNETVALAATTYLLDQVCGRAVKRVEVAELKRVLVEYIDAARGPDGSIDGTKGPA